MVNTLFKGVRCLECGEERTAQLFPAACPSCDGAWTDAVNDLSSLPANWPKRVAKRPTNLWRYQELLPFVPDTGMVSFNEGWTPLLRAENLQEELGHAHIWIKDERQNPTGSFKDRQAALTVNALKANGVDEVVLASAGNAAAAYAAYCAKAGIKLWVFLTSSVPSEKMRELALYGAEVVKVTGTYDQAKKVAANFAAHRGIYCDAGAKAIANKESMKTVAFEIVEQLDWQAPDWYIQAVSGGLGPIGVLKGFKELFEAKIIDRVPKIGVVQVDGCAPMVQAWEQGLADANAIVPDTLITVLGTGDPGMGYQILKEANDQYGGAMVSVGDGDAFRTMRRLARIEGMSVEPAASVAFAGFEKLLAQNFIDPEESVVINCSGHTFSAEKHALEDRYIIELDLGDSETKSNSPLELSDAIRELDEQVTSIVVVDDNPQDCRLIRKLLQRYKRYRIFEAYSGAEGIDLIKQRQPQLVILDLRLPDMDGFSILEELKSDERTKEIPAIIISGLDLDPDQQEALRGNAQSVWQKGNFDARQLVDYVVELLGDEAELVSDPTPQEQNKKLISDFGLEKHPKVLVIDDNVWDSRLMRRLLEIRQRFEVIETHSARTGLNAAREVAPDIIILDLVLPDIRGEEVLKELRTQKETAHIPVIIVSAKELDPQMRAELHKNAESVWPKDGLDRNNLVTHVEAVLEMERNS
ncbi:MAG: pyridoxal-phosphate dependent enzyme [Chloroflexi bacterium]|nr:MAG: pyridoxal-phosphate dependent enzyme [Chloroflexota bacterium]MBL1194143.1 pyridoxal-phosphate dependent enzyme [Chloroflexota bacterium]NOH11436.1 pyridoxal-phosphate dependent enzyme [Chloroflexota bacterium]